MSTIQESGRRTLGARKRCGLTVHEAVLRRDIGAPAATPRQGPLDFVAKRRFDLVVGIVLTVALAPFMLVVALLVKLTSRGPVLFVDERIGFDQRAFRCYKFRTMHRDAAARQGELEPLNEAGGALFKIRHDPRVTPVGKLLRRTSLDELPQLFNVLKGEMSLVGPRPLPVRDFRLMDDADKRRHVVLPGITGLWQVSGRSELPFDQMIALDCRYIESWSLAGDLSILARTVGAVCWLRGAS
jgi:lipopolysaccharide/colanic/teichoic acid biosynthesis glycosyltransferase